MTSLTVGCYKKVILFRSIALLPGHFGEIFHAKLALYLRVFRRQQKHEFGVGPCNPERHVNVIDGCKHAQCSSRPSSRWRHRSRCLSVRSLLSITIVINACAGLKLFSNKAYHHHRHHVIIIIIIIIIVIVVVVVVVIIIIIIIIHVDLKLEGNNRVQVLYYVLFLQEEAESHLVLLSLHRILCSIHNMESGLCWG